MHLMHRRLFCFLLLSLAAHAFISPDNLARDHPVIPRQVLPPASSTASTTSRSASTRTTTTTTSSATSASVSTSASSSDSTSSLTSDSDTPSSVPSTTQRPVVTSVNVSTDSEGRISTFTVIASATSSPSRTPTQSSSNAPASSGGLGTGSIIGLSVAGGVAVISIVAFLVWKLTRKRFSDFDDNEAIKWPELNAHGTESHALPVHNTGRAGFDTGSEVSFSRAPSTDPYAVPPLPHLNPNQPYRDDPTVNAYYDPYRGPVPNTFNDAASMDVPPGPGWSNAEAFPMTQMTSSRGPGPQMAYDVGAAGRQSPAPQAAYGQVGYVDGNPVPNVGLGGVQPLGRRSPGPQIAYDMPR